MGLKTIAFAPFKQGKTVFGLTMAELGPIGVIDTESRIQWYTLPHPTIAPREFPWDNPRILRTDNQMCARNPKLKAAFERAGVVYLVQTSPPDMQLVGRAVEAWHADPAYVGTVLDSGSILWDISQDTVDEADEKMKMLAWVPVKRYHRRLTYALMTGNKHAIINAHVQEKMKLVKKDGKSEFVSTGSQPWLEKKTPHWADLVVAFVLPEGAKWPTLVVVGEGFGGAGDLSRGTRVENPTFAEIVARIGGDATPVGASVSAKEIEYRNKVAMVHLAGTPVVPGVDGKND